MSTSDTVQRFINTADEAIERLQRKKAFLQSVLECLEQVQIQRRRQKQKQQQQRAEATPEEAETKARLQEELKRVEAAEVCTETEEESNTSSHAYCDDFSDSSYDEDMEFSETSSLDSFANHKEFDDDADKEEEVRTPLPASLTRKPSRRTLLRRCSVTKYNLDALAKPDHTVEQKSYRRTVEDMARPNINRFNVRRTKSGGSLDRHLGSTSNTPRVERRCSVTKFNLEDCGSVHSGMTSLEEIPQDSIRSARAA